MPLKEAPELWSFGRFSGKTVMHMMSRGEELREQECNLVCLAFRHHSHCLITQEQAFRRGPFGKNDFMLPQEDMKVIDLSQFVGLFDAGQPDKLVGGNKDAALAEHALDDWRANQQPVLGRDNHVPFRKVVAERTGPDRDGTKLGVLGQSVTVEVPEAHPNDRPIAAIRNRNQISGTQILDPNFAAHRRNLGSPAKTYCETGGVRCKPTGRYTGQGKAPGYLLNCRISVA